MTARDAAEAIDAELRSLVETAELQAAYHREFIPDGVAAPAAVRQALEAAMNSGVAIGLERARAVVASVVRDSL